MNKNMEINIVELLKALAKRIWIVILCAVLVGGAMFAYTMNFVTPQYSASVSIYVNNKTTTLDNAAISSGDLAVALRLVDTYVNIIQSNRVLEKVLEETNIALSAGQLRGMISAGAIGETEMFRVSVTSPNPQMSADLANAVAKVAPGVISDIIEGSSAKVIDYANVPGSPSSPNYRRSAMLGALLGAVLAVFGIIASVQLDTRIKSEEDLRNICKVPVIGVIPDLATPVKKSGKKGVR